MAEKRYRNFASVLYPESATEGWLEWLRMQHVPAFVSPLHDQDLNPDGEPKKAHYHILIFFEGSKSLAQAAEIFQPMGCVGLEVVQSLRSYARYLCHLDNPDKHQYLIEDVQCCSGADYSAVIGTALDKYKAIGEMIDFCEETNVVSYSDLLNYCRRERFDWFRVLCDNGTLVMREYLKSRGWSTSRSGLVRRLEAVNQIWDDPEDETVDLAQLLPRRRSPGNLENLE